MRLIYPDHKILSILDSEYILKILELAGRTCYKSEDKISEDSAKKFIKNIIKSGHHSVIEHINITVKFICDRGVSHELVRHRLASFSQESTRYVKYANHCNFIIPFWLNLKPGYYTFDKLDSLLLREDEYEWVKNLLNVEKTYQYLLDQNWSLDKARSILPNATKTTIVITANLREWRHILTLRCSKRAHPQMREIMLPVLQDFYESLPVIFDDVYDSVKGGV